MFGLGLIGHGVLQSLVKRETPALARLAFSWDSPSLQDAQFEAVGRHIADALPVDALKKRELDIVWSAGRGGFAASEAVFAAEQDTYQRVLEHFRKLTTSAGFARVRFHLLSSAGGLFEGQRHITANSPPRPERPYGFAKLKQETVLKAQFPEFIPFVYRPSSVYGYADEHSRPNLIAALLQQAILQGTATVYGGPSTLRDYVLSDDIGRFIASRVLLAPDQGETCVLASGKPSSTFEILNQVQQVTQRQIKVRYVLGSDNVRSNSFSPSGLPENWYPTSTELGIGIAARRMTNAILLNRPRPARGPR
ncbi:MAG: NAD-dependent epimerase/dehydratase family protein [Pannonibacter sp.]